MSVLRLNDMMVDFTDLRKWKNDGKWDGPGGGGGGGIVVGRALKSRAEAPVMTAHVVYVFEHRMRGPTGGAEASQVSEDTSIHLYTHPHILQRNKLPFFRTTLHAIMVILPHENPLPPTATDLTLILDVELSEFTILSNDQIFSQS